jgi:hypothetical protein
VKATHVRTARGKLARCAGLALLLSIFALPAPAFAEVGNSGDNGCTTTNYSGTALSGDWTRSYNPNCANNTKATIGIHWYNYIDGGGDRHIVYYGSIGAQQINGSKCVEVALDWDNPTGAHSDVQFIRNCFENSTRSVSTVDINVGPQRLLVGQPWPVRRLQIGVYDPADGSVSNKVCPSSGSAPVDTNTDAECSGPTGWFHNPAAAFGDKSAKIWRRTNTGGDDQNTPLWPGAYDLNALTDYAN